MTNEQATVFSIDNTLSTLKKYQTGMRILLEGAQADTGSFVGKYEGGDGMGSRS